MLDQITPVLLTCNEAPNIGRTLDRLAWARDIVVVDSGSRDATLEIVRQYPNVRLFERAMDTFWGQWNYAVHETAITSGWILALDADYVLPDDFVAELRSLRPATDCAGVQARFRWCVHGRVLRGSIYPPVTVLFRRAAGRYVQDGHTQRLEVEGIVEKFRAKIHHDDRKPLSYWLKGQEAKIDLECEWLIARRWRELGWADRLRRYTPLAPLAVFVYCLLGRGLVLDGWAGVFYSAQRMFAEAMLLLKLTERRLELGVDGAGRGTRPAR